MVKFVNVRLQVATSSHDALNFTIKRCLIFPKFCQFLSVSDQDVFLKGNLRLDFFLLALFLLESGLSLTLGDVKLLDEEKLILELGLEGVELGLLSLESLLFLEEVLVFECNPVSVLGEFG